MGSGMGSGSGSGGPGASQVLSEPLVLSRVLYVCGVLVECSGAGIDTPQIAKHLFQTLFVSRLHAAASVRRSTVYAASRVFAVVSESALLAQCGDDLPELIAWLIDTERHDADTETKRLAAHCLVALQHLLGDNPFAPNAANATNATKAAPGSVSIAMARPSGRIPSPMVPNPRNGLACMSRWLL